MPKASAPNAPCVLVCESPHTTVMPGSVAPCSGPITWTMPWRLSRNGKYASAPHLADVARRAFDLQARDRVGDAVEPLSQSVVGTLWSAVATIDVDAPRLAAGQLAGLRTPADS